MQRRNEGQKEEQSRAVNSIYKNMWKKGKKENEGV